VSTWPKLIIAYDVRRGGEAWLELIIACDVSGRGLAYYRQTGQTSQPGYILHLLPLQTRTQKTACARRAV